MKNIVITPRPPEKITEGTKVTLTASGPGTITDCKWRVDGPGIVDQRTLTTPDSADSCVIHWDTCGLQTGSYKISVTAKLDAAYSKGLVASPVANTEDTGEIYIDVQSRSLSAKDMEGMATGAKEFVKQFKDNIDSKMDNLTGEVSKVASGVGALADQASGGGQPLKVVLQRPATIQTLDQALWPAIRHHTEMIGFNRYSQFIDRVLCVGTDQDGLASPPSPSALDLGAPTLDERRNDLINRPTIHGVDAYELLRTATEVFLILECGIGIRHGDLLIVAEEESRLGAPITLPEITARLQQYLGSTSALPYLTRIVDALFGLDPATREQKLPYCEGILRNRFSCPSLIELIWSYWHEEGMLVQTLNAIALRFQNRHRGGDRDPLAHLEIDPLRPLNNLFWGYIQSEYKRISVPRRAYEYDHHYGLSLYGKAVPAMRTADSRSKFLEAYHNLLYRTSVFYQEDADTTVIADGFPLLVALREVHLLLAEGAHNQFGDLPWTARVEMLIEQWLLARPEIREFLRGRAMVPYKEGWMSQVDTMKRLQGWTDTTITHFSDLGVWGEQIVLSIRYGDWIDVNDQEQAKNWARYWRPEVQGYIHAYRAVTGVDLSVETVGTEKGSARYLQPSVHLRNRLVEQQRRPGRV
jgi:hypothetical protein